MRQVACAFIPTRKASATVHGKATEGLIQIALRGALTQVQARRLADENPEVLALALLAASKRIAASAAPLMSVYRTLNLRGHNPTKTIAEALKTYLTTGQLPPLTA